MNYFKKGKYKLILQKGIKRLDIFFLSNVDPKTKLLGSLVLITILAHLIIWPIMDFSEGKIWIYANTRLPLYKLFNPSVDGGYFEHFQYILLSWSAALSFLICLRQNKLVYPIPIIYLFLFIDDSFGIHDRAFKGILIPFYEKTILSEFTIVRLKDFAEISYWIFILFLVLLIIIPALKYGNSISRKFISNNFKFFISLAFFASFVDLIESNIFRWIYLKESSFLYYIVSGFFIILEEAGEILVIALSFLWLFDIVANKKLVKIEKFK